MMHTPINTNGLRRVARLYLERSAPLSKTEALVMLKGTLGAYDDDGSSLALGIEDYFTTRPALN
ncbi:hypothetical protein GCM10017044_21380 [Kordiimonas sediminis]|uniref:Uncharacterized protein n=1 Tax=Kordiimonas sediminis TaxID=1735581 RepID=A0A919AV00_9PROT|nr:hypothetical protein [Kordiimonas sediminis]GHF26204.1 hypothetical protein GCM10017044_21380 [Kordiimonas sediminis]